MGLKKKILELGTAALIGLNSLMPSNAFSSDCNLENRINIVEPEKPKKELKLFNDGFFSHLVTTYMNWYFADLFMVGVHEQGHYDAAYNQHNLAYDNYLNPSLDFYFSPLFIGGVTHIGSNNVDKRDQSMFSIGGFKNTGLLAESLKAEIFSGRISGDELKFKSMFALISELNLPFYLGQHYLGTAPPGDDIENFTLNSGVSPETMAISSGIHMLVNAPYIYYLTKNALGSNPKVLESKPYFLSFRYDGDSYMLYLHLDIDKL